jgi:GINS complex subunit 4
MSRQVIKATLTSQIERYSHHITLTPALHPLLSGAELSHAQRYVTGPAPAPLSYTAVSTSPTSLSNFGRYTDLLHTHYKHSVLDSLPEWLRNMDDRVTNTTDMSECPFLTRPS